MFQFNICVLFIYCVVSAYGSPTGKDLLPDTSVCGIYTESKIFGGEAADLNDFPWVALLEYETVRHQKILRNCHGSLINNRYILTAAHCIQLKGEHRTTKLTRVRLGEYDIETSEDCVRVKRQIVCAPPPINIPVEKAFVHEKFNEEDPNRHNDIGLIRMVAEVPYSEYIRPICMPIHKFDIAKKKKYMVTGWGLTEKKRKSNIKLKVQLETRFNEECSYGGKYLLNEDQICAGGEKNMDTCKGDSGAPLMSVELNKDSTDVNWQIIGIVSFGPNPCGIEKMPGVYVNVYNYVDWIIRHLKP